jgi:integrase
MKEQKRTGQNRKSGGAEPVLRHFSKTDIRHWEQVLFHDGYTRDGERRELPDWSVRMQHNGRRGTFSLGTANKVAASAKARDIYLCLNANGWESTLERFKPKPVKSSTETKPDCSVGEFIDEIKRKADGNPKTIEGYCKSFRQIVADISGIDGGKEKFDHRKGGHEKWLESVHKIKLGSVTPAKIQEWKRSFLLRAGSSAVSLRRARVSVNSLVRQAKSLFSPKITRHLELELPQPLPFSGVEFEPRSSLKYRSRFDVQKLIQAASADLSESKPELFKIFLLAVMVGLRRKEIDLLEWESFLWDTGVIRIEETQYFQPKSQESVGDIPVDAEVLEIFRGYRARARGPFVIQSRSKPKPDIIYQYYRCEGHFEKLTTWLRKKGVHADKPLHTLRKEYGSQICSMHGIHAASRALRHSDIRVTNEYYADSKARVTPGMGHLLKPSNVTPLQPEIDPEEKAVHG